MSGSDRVRGSHILYVIGVPGAIATLAYAGIYNNWAGIAGIFPFVAILWFGVFFESVEEGHRSLGTDSTRE